MPRKEPIYIETSVWSAVADPRIPGRQRLTRNFLRIMARHRRLLVSDLAIFEIENHPRPELRAAIQRFLRRMRPRVFGPSAKVREATRELLALGGWGRKLVADVTQVGYALVGGAIGFATWNQKDLAREEMRRVIGRYCRRHGRPVLQIGTPSEVAQWLGVKT